MGKFQFTEDDYNLLKGLIDITSAIKDTYEDLNEIEKLTIIAFMQIYFRTCILFLSSKDFDNLKKKLQLEIPLLGINDLLVEEGIRNIFKEMKSDKELPHLISLSPNLN